MSERDPFPIVRRLVIDGVEINCAREIRVNVHAQEPTLVTVEIQAADLRTEVDKLGRVLVVKSLAARRKKPTADPS